jgi:hypothetical protein
MRGEEEAVILTGRRGVVGRCRFCCARVEMRGARRVPLLEPPGENSKRTRTAALAAGEIRGSPLFEPEPQSRRPVATATLREDTGRTWAVSSGVESLAGGDDLGGATIELSRSHPGLAFGVRCRRIGWRRRGLRGICFRRRASRRLKVRGGVGQGSEGRESAG